MEYKQTQNSPELIEKYGQANVVVSEASSPEERGEFKAKLEIKNLSQIIVFKNWENQDGSSVVEMPFSDKSSQNPTLSFPYKQEHVESLSKDSISELIQILDSSRYDVNDLNAETKMELFTRIVSIVSEYIDSNGIDIGSPNQVSTSTSIPTLSRMNKKEYFMRLPANMTYFINMTCDHWDKANTKNIEECRNKSKLAARQVNPNRSTSINNW